MPEKLFEKLLKSIEKVLMDAGFPQLAVVPTSDDLPLLEFSDAKFSASGETKCADYEDECNFKILYTDQFTSDDEYFLISARVDKLISLIHNSNDALAATGLIDKKNLGRLFYNSRKSEILYEQQETNKLYCEWEITFYAKFYNPDFSG